MNAKKDKNLMIRMEADLHRLCKIEAVKAGLTMREIVTELLREWLRNRPLGRY